VKESVARSWPSDNDAIRTRGRGERTPFIGGDVRRPPMRLVVLLALPVLVWGAAGCAARAGRGDEPGGRQAVIDRIVSTTAKIVVERSGERVASGSGVVVASSGAGEEPATFVLTAAHLIQGKPDAAVYVRFTGTTAGRDRLLARVVRRGDVDSLDLALLRVPGVALAPVSLADPAEVRLGEEILVVGFPWGKRLALFGGIVSQVPAEGAPDSPAEERGGPSVMVDASVGNGVSGGGVYQEATGRLLGVVEGYRTASVALKDRTQTFSLKVPMPGETFVIAVEQIREFLKGSGIPAEAP
jgi:S1-C subfamily serine protease